MEYLYTLFWLFVGHAVADFALQSDSMAKGKNRNSSIDLSKIPPGQKLQTVWFYWLTAHAMIHAGAVALATGYVILGIGELILHWIIDWCKCENITTIHIDQILHILCKLLWVYILIP